MYEGGDEKKIAKLFPAYLMNPADRETFHPRNFCCLQYTMLSWQMSKRCQVRSIITLMSKHILKYLASHSHVVDEALTQMVYTR